MGLPSVIARGGKVSLYDYKASQAISVQDYPFYALIMAAMRQADTFNLESLKSIFPDVFTELRERYNAPGGLLRDEEAVKC